MSARRKLRSGKAPGPDHMPPEVVMFLAKRSPDFVLDSYNGCLSSGLFPRKWKVDRLVFLRKPNKSRNIPSCSRPICLMDFLENLYEHLVMSRLKWEPEDKKTYRIDSLNLERISALTTRMKEMIKNTSCLYGLGEATWSHPKAT